MTINQNSKSIARNLLIIFVLFIHSIFFYYYYYFIDGFHWCLSNSKSPQLSRTILGILPDLNDYIVSTRPQGLA